MDVASLIGQSKVLSNNIQLQRSVKLSEIIAAMFEIFKRTEENLLKTCFMTMEFFLKGAEVTSDGPLKHEIESI